VPHRGGRRAAEVDRAVAPARHLRQHRRPAAAPAQQLPRRRVAEDLSQGLDRSWRLFLVVVVIVRVVGCRDFEGAQRHVHGRVAPDRDLPDGPLGFGQAVAKVQRVDVGLRLLVAEDEGVRLAARPEYHLQMGIRRRRRVRAARLLGLGNHLVGPG
jgi:hypothetical protein